MRPGTIVDGERLELPELCPCGARRDDASYVGPQDTSTPGDFLLLGNCVCRSTIVLDGVNDAARCQGCRALIIGDDEDPHVCVERADHSNAVYCADCAPKLLGLCEAFETLGLAQIQLNEAAIPAPAFRLRSRPITLGDIRALQENR